MVEPCHTQGLLIAGGGYGDREGGSSSAWGPSLTTLDLSFPIWPGKPPRRECQREHCRTSEFGLATPGGSWQQLAAVMGLSRAQPLFIPLLAPPSLASHS